MVYNEQIARAFGLAVLLLSTSCYEPSEKWKEAECIPDDPDKPPCPKGTICLSLDYRCHTLCANEDSSRCPLEQACYPEGVCRDYEAECDASNPCMGDFYCDASTHSCRKKSGLGSACSRDDVCWSGTCQDGFCCTSCEQSCMACSEALTGQSSGACANILAGKKRGEEDCPDPLFCDGAGGCATKAPGEPCAADLECTSRFCSPDGVCCDEACDASGCVACTEESTGVASGTCANVLAGLNPFGECAAGLRCDGDGQCFDEPQSTQCSESYECRTGHCTDGYCCGAVCDGLCEACRNDWTGAANGTCAPIRTGTDPDTECGDATCTGDGSCSAPAPNGSPCGRDDQCASNKCVDNVCCDSPCAGGCEACTAEKNAVADGTCAPLPAFSDPEAECLEGDAAGCNGAGACKVAVWLTTPDLPPRAGDEFGKSVGISGDYAVVGAPGEDGTGLNVDTNTGAAYVFRRTGDAWDAATTIVAPDDQAGDSFGGAVALSGEYAIVGAVGEDGGTGDPRPLAGAAYVFRRTGPETWDDGTKIMAPVPQADERFGRSVAISGEYAIVGTDPGADSGAAYVFHRTGIDTWDTGTELVVTDPHAGDTFGRSVAISGSYAIVGAPGADGGDGELLAGTGVAYVFLRTGNTWDGGTKIVAPDAQTGDGFGESVSISGDYAIVGAPGEDGADDGSLNGAGAAYAFLRRTRNLWDGGTKIVAPDRQAGNRFGWSVAISGEYAIVGALSAGTVGAAHVFRRATDTWNAESKLVAPVGPPAFWFGGSVAISDGNAIVGAHGSPLYSHDDAGSAYVY